MITKEESRKKREYYLRHKERIKARAIKHYYENRDAILVKRGEHYRANKEEHLARSYGWASRNVNFLRDYQRKYREENKNIIALQKSEWFQENKSRVIFNKRVRRQTDLNFRLSEYLRSRINKAVKGGWKAGSAVSDLGCSIDEFKVWIYSQFESGMTWDNYGEWHLDHVIPLSSFDLENRMEFLEACHWLNYQPLWAKDNLSKGATYRG